MCYAKSQNYCKFKPSSSTHAGFGPFLCVLGFIGKRIVCCFLWLRSWWFLVFIFVAFWLAKPQHLVALSMNQVYDSRMSTNWCIYNWFNNVLSYILYREHNVRDQVSIWTGTFNAIPFGSGKCEEYIMKCILKISKS